MKQFQFVYKTDETFRAELAHIRQWREAHPSHTTLFRIYSEDMDLAHIGHVCELLDADMPDALYLGCTTQGNILDGAISTSNIILTCTVFEYETTRVQLLQLPFTAADVPETVGALRAYCEANPWVSCVELYATVLGMSVREFRREMDCLRSDIQIFGGGACNPDANDFTTYVFSKGNGISDHGVVFLLFGGSDFHVFSTYVSGWKPLRRKFHITRASGRILTELDGEPAFQVYQRFLRIDPGGKFVSNTLEFPLLMNDHGIDVLRCPLMVNEDNSLLLTAEVTEAADLRLAYGDPQTILSSILHDGQKIADFRPEVIQTFSCAARRAFWSDDNISNETLPLCDVAPVSGYYTGGEFLRIGSDLFHFNITLVFAAMREGDGSNRQTVNLSAAQPDEETSRMSLIRHFVSVIEAYTSECEALREKLTVTSITDGLTGLYNRAEIERRIRAAVEAKTDFTDDLSILMLDIDDFKKINDVCGHQEGDRVILAIADVLRQVLSDLPSASIGRWGGEEFMVLLPDCPVEQAAALAEQIREAFAAVRYELAAPQSVSIGVTRARSGDNADSLYVCVDRALYAAKAGGKNRVIRQ